MTFNYTLEPNHSSIKTLVYFPVSNREPETKTHPVSLAYGSHGTKPQIPDAKVPIPGTSDRLCKPSKDLHSVSNWLV